MRHKHNPAKKMAKDILADIAPWRSPKWEYVKIERIHPRKGNWQKKEPKVNACRATRLFQYLTEDADYKEYVSSKKIYRCGTSIGANVRESQHAQSDADFLSKLSIAYKEADESDYWINLLHDNGYINDTQFISINSDITRILKILTTIVKKLRIKTGKQASDLG